LLLPREFLHMCRRNRRRIKVVDSTGASLTGGSLLLRTLLLRRLLLREVLKDGEQYLGLIVPPSAAGVAVNAAVPLTGRIGVNLNYTLSAPLLNHCIEQCGIRHVVTSRKVMERLKLEVGAELVYLEDLAAKATAIDKLAAAFAARVTPLPMLERQLGLASLKPDDVLTVIFTSGSTGNPKGVMLTHRNVGSNIHAIAETVRLTATDVAMGVLPFFHSYGYTATLWTVLALDPKGAYHFNPLDAHQVSKLCREHGVTVFMATPTFLRTYLKRCAPEDLAKVELVYAAAEKSSLDIFDAFEKRFGVRPLEAYGCTELSPLVSVNVPASRSPKGDTTCQREGTVGRPIVGVKAKVVQLETGTELPADEPGMLLVSGPNVMKGYLDQPELTASVIRDGWYVTGDIAKIDTEGFITITGRESRFSKMGGEMVPHGLIEEKLQKILGGDEDHLQAVVTAVPDARKGERLVVVHVALAKTPEEISRELATAGLPNLWIPSTDSYVEVEHIPVLGTGKLDLKGIRDVALKRFGPQPQDRTGSKTS
jgi:acyl-[acyl-carrier-protein]-phospholipid O-acyltransferase/long-chain-fatty-acid--[acyl-carrier-protein] ligase